MSLSHTQIMQKVYDSASGSLKTTGGASGSSTGTITDFSATNDPTPLTDKQALAANTSRKYLLFQNQDSAAKMWLKFGGPASNTGGSLRLGPGESLEMQGFQTTQALHVISDTALAPYACWEGA